MTPIPDLTTIPEGAVRLHLEHMRIRNNTVTSVYSRHRTLVRLRKWAGEAPILYLDEADLARWQSDRAAELHAESLRTETSHLRQFYAWAVRERLLDTDPTWRLIMPRVARRVPRPMPDAKLAAAMLAAEPDVGAVLGLAAFAGLRALEIARLDWAEVDLGTAAPMLRVVAGKGGHGRIVPLSRTLVDLLSTLPHRRGPVIRRRDGQPRHHEAHRISTLANDHLHSLGITETLHQCRHRFATATYRASRDLRAVQDLLGHASPTTTAIYAQASLSAGREAVEAAGLLAA